MFVKLAKQRAGYRFKQKYGSNLWQDGYYDHVLRDQEKTERVIFYVITNPLRSHLVENLLDYPFWGSGLYSREELLAHIGCRP
jgi:putative transposase